MTVPVFDFTVTAEKMVRRWAPLIWLAPDEQFLPGSVSDFLNHVTPKPRSPADTQHSKVPMGPDSKTWFLVTKSEVGELYVTPVATFTYALHAPNLT